MNTKTLVATMMLGAATVSPALAQAGTPHSQLLTFTTQHGDGGPTDQLRYTKRSYDLYRNGHYVGSTPDPNIRMQLQRDLDGGE
jgi:hypothetical protein